MINSLKKLKRVLSGKDFYFRTTVELNKSKIGSSYGGWWIATDRFKDNQLIVFSFGLGEDLSFDVGMMEKYNCKVYGFDPTPKSIQYVESLNLDDDFSLYKYALSDVNGTLVFNLPENEVHVSGSLESIASNKSIEVECRNITTICEELDVRNIDILKMDIEGSEYKIIEDMVKSKIFPKQILIEYHHFFDSFSNNETKKSIELLFRNGYDLFHIDGYNYSFIQNNNYEEIQ